MQSSSYFPSAQEPDRKKQRIDRRGQLAIVSKKTRDIAGNFLHQPDWDDFFEKHGIYNKPPHRTRSHKEKTVPTMAYELMTAIILICKSGHSFRNDEIAKEIIDEAITYQEYQGGNVPLIGILQQQVENIRILYDTLSSWPGRRYAARGEKEFGDFTIYRGFKQYRYDRLFNLPLSKSGLTLKNGEEIEGEIITIPTFLSTSINLNTALRFAAGDDKYLWEILVPKEKSDIFKYVYFGDDTTLDEDDSLESESEILLNIGTKLKYVGTTLETYEYFWPSATGTPELRTVDCIHQKFVFEGYEETDLSLRRIADLYECLSEFDPETLARKPRPNSSSGGSGYSRKKRKSSRRQRKKRKSSRRQRKKRKSSRRKTRSGSSRK